MTRVAKGLCGMGDPSDMENLRGVGGLSSMGDLNSMGDLSGIGDLSGMNLSGVGSLSGMLNDMHVTLYVHVINVPFLYTLPCRRGGRGKAHVHLFDATEQGLGPAIDLHEDQIVARTCVEMGGVRVETKFVGACCVKQAGRGCSIGI
ncbi:hypothetical protein BC937DRAFT_89298 [Endogone sp. FLAS-F59071]|nr:hypothetical protein BC937DRAFT_89298 [Endogone sp. FLAS-F59071]|eukprot:RUS17971.1 hypothetical protein BC937DRAFT_89298 [Endogone sp. FLAS-F59071]